MTEVCVNQNHLTAIGNLIKRGDYDMAYIDSSNLGLISVRVHLGAGTFGGKYSAGYYITYLINEKGKVVHEGR